MAELFTIEQVKADPAGDYVLAEMRDGRRMYRRVMSEDEIYQSAYEEWLGVLAQLWIAYDKEIDLERLDLYKRQFATVPMGLLQKGVDRTIREHTFNSVPTVADVWRAVRKELGNPRDLDVAIANWGSSLWNQVNLLKCVDAEMEEVHV